MQKIGGNYNFGGKNNSSPRQQKSAFDFKTNRQNIATMEYTSSDRGTVKVLKGSDKKKLVDFDTKAGINFSLISIDHDCYSNERTTFKTTI
jgi:hypothetical protein